MPDSKVRLNPPPVNLREFNSRGWRDWFSTVHRRLGEGPLMVQGYSAGGLPPAEEWGTTSVPTFTSIIFVYDESGGATLAFSDGTNWRRVQDRAIVS